MRRARVREDEVIPYEASDLTGRRILVLAAHPDDEVLGPGGAVALASASAEEVRTWIATDGSRQEGVASEDGAAYGARRRDEAARAAEALGINSPLFGEFPDRGLTDRRRELGEALEKLFGEFRPDLVFCPSPVEIHPDHRALAETLYERLASSRPGDPAHDARRLTRIAFYEISHPLLPNALVDIASVAVRKESALSAYRSQQDVRDYAGALGGLNAYRRLTLSGRGPAEAFRVLSYGEASTRSLEEFRRSIGPALVSDGALGVAPAAVVVRTRNRPALLKEALASLAGQTMRPARVVVVNDGGGSVADVIAPFRSSYDVVLEELPQRVGRSAAANRGVELAGEELVGFLDDDDRLYPDHLERLVGAHRAGPEPIVYSDAVTIVYRRRGESWEESVRALQYSLDFDPEYLLLANYIPLHTLLLPAALYRRLGGFDTTLEYSEDWDLAIRLSFETSFRHVRAVTCEYRVFEPSDGDPAHARAGAEPFQEARRAIYERYRDRRTEQGLARTLDRLRAQVALWYERDASSQREVERLSGVEAQKARLESERGRLAAELDASAARAAELLAANQDYRSHLLEAHGEIDRLTGILNQIYGSRTWKLHLLLDKLRGRG